MDIIHQTGIKLNVKRTALRDKTGRPLDADARKKIYWLLILAPAVFYRPTGGWPERHSSTPRVQCAAICAAGTEGQTIAEPCVIVGWQSCVSEKQLKDRSLPTNANFQPFNPVTKAFQSGDRSATISGCALHVIFPHHAFW